MLHTDKFNPEILYAVVPKEAQDVHIVGNLFLKYINRYDSFFNNIDLPFPCTILFRLSEASIYDIEEVEPVHCYHKDDTGNIPFYMDYATGRNLLLVRDSFESRLTANGIILTDSQDLIVLKRKV